MAQYRLINCEFVNASSFKNNVSNKAQLLYLSMIFKGDDLGFVDTTRNIIESLKDNDNTFTKTENLSLLENTYESALQELISNGYLYEFTDKHQNKIHLIRHWFFHNKYKQGLWTNYQAFRKQVYLENGEYLMGKPKKENNKENKIKQDKINEYKVSEETIQTENDIEDSDELNPDDYPFPIDMEKLKKGDSQE